MLKRWALISLALALCVISTWTFDPQSDGSRGRTEALEGPVTASRPAASPGHASLPEVRVEPNAPQLASRSPAAPQDLQAPPLPYRYVGQMTYEGATVAFLERQNKVSNARVGDILEGTYRVDAIKPQSVSLTYLPLNVTQIALASEATPAADRPIDIVFKAPSQAAQGSTIDVSVGVPARAAVQSANFLLTYDANALDLLEVTDATGATASNPYHPPGTVELNYDPAEGAAHVPTARFYVKGGDLPRPAEIAVTAQLLDGAGKTIAINPFVPHSVMLTP